MKAFVIIQIDHSPEDSKTLVNDLLQKELSNSHFLKINEISLDALKVIDNQAEIAKVKKLFLTK